MKLLGYMLITLFSFNSYSTCSEYYFSLDFGGRIGDGVKITEYLVKEKVPHIIFMVGYNLNTPEAQALCKKINTDPEYKKYVKVGNHTKSHKGFKKEDTGEYIKNEIIGNENQIKAKCTSSNFVKVFRYPKGQSHPIAEIILEANNYTQKFSKYSDEKFQTKMGVGWTSDTRDWIEEGAASLWAQETYYKRHNEFMPVSENSKKELSKYSKTLDDDNLLKKAILAGKEPEVFNKNFHEEIEGWHGPSQENIEERILNDKGVDGKCVPLTHFGGYNTLAALKNVIPKLKAEGKKFTMLDDSLDYALKNIKMITDQSSIDLTSDINPKSCQLPNDAATKSEKLHKVKEGETLWKIANEHGLSVELIKEMNNLSTNEIEINQLLRLAPNKIIHIVKAGDTLYRIAKTYDVTVDQIKKWNSIDDSEIDLDQQIKIIQ